VAEPKTAFTLAGGGTKGAFEAGALAYLVEERGILPDVITASSLGAILAQARTPEEFRARTEELGAGLLAMTHADLLFGKQPWVAALEGTPFEVAFDTFLVGATRPPIPGADDELLAGPGEGPGPRRRKLARWASLARRFPALLRARRGLRAHPSSLLTLEPLGAALRHGDVLGMAPLVPELVARPGLELRLAVAALGAAELHYVDGTGTLRGPDARTSIGDPTVSIDLIEGVLASASVPVLFPPRQLGSEMYVDGGVLQNIPVEAAVNLGAERIIAVLAVPLSGTAPTRDFSQTNMVDVFLRAVGDLPLIARQRADLAVPLPAGTSLTVIDPLVDIVGPFEVAQGLMLIDMDYGWLRAADVLAPFDDAVRAAAEAATDAIVTARTQAWHFEERLWSQRHASIQEVAKLRALKARVAEAVRERAKLGVPLPIASDGWAVDYERHAEPVPDGLPPSVGAPGA
jgi:NTE family protein